MKYRAIRCPCSASSCSNWLVEPAADIQGVKFTRFQATAVAALLNGLPPDVDPMAPAPELEATKPLILYFGNDEDRTEFVEIVQDAKPGLIARKL